MLDSVSADLKNDRLKDIAVILQHNDSVTLINIDEATVIANQGS